MATVTKTGSTALTGSTYIDTWGNGSTYIKNTQHYYVGYSGSAAVHRFSTCFKLTVPEFEGKSSSFTLKVTLAKAVDGFSNRKYKVSVSRNTTNASLQSGYYDRSVTWTNTITATISSTANTISTTFDTTVLNPGDELYVYVYSGAAEYNTCKCTAITGTVSYSYSETTDETGYEGVSRLSVANCTSTGGRPGKSSFPEYTNPVNLSPTPVKSGSSFYIRIYQLQYAPKTYTFYVYKKSSTWSFTGHNTNPSLSGGTLIKTFTPTDSDLDGTGSGCYIKIDLPSSDFKIGSTTSLAIISHTSASGYTDSLWGIGSAYANGAPQTINITLDPPSWIENYYSNSLTTVTSTSATINHTFSADNSPRYVNYIYARTKSTSTSGASSRGGSAYTQTTTQMSATTGSQNKSMTISGLTPGTSYKVYFACSTSSSYASSTYYGLSPEPLEFDTDAEMENYSATIEASVTGKTTTTLNVTSLTTDTNLTGIYFAVKTDVGKSVDSLSSYDSSDGEGIYLTGLTAGTTYTYYIYAQSSASGIFYRLNSVTFTTDADYTGTLSTVNIGTTTATLAFTDLSSTINLDGKWYLSKVSNSSPVSNLSYLDSESLGTTGTANGLTEASSNTLYAYVYSSASKLYYPVTNTTFLTSASNYSATFTATGITPTSVVLCMFNIYPTMNLSSTYYVTSTYYGDEVNVIDVPGGNIGSYSEMLTLSAQFSHSCTINDLVPGIEYTMHFYVYNTESSKYMHVGSQTFTTYSSIIYRGNNGVNEPCRIYKLNDDTGRLEGVCLYSEGHSEPLVTSDGKTIKTSDGQVFNTTEGKFLI